MVKRLGALCTLLVGLLGGCGGSGNDTTKRYIASCDNYCTAAASCNSSVDATQCSSDCQAQLGDVGPNLSAEFLAEYDDCASSGDCTQLAITTALTNACFNRARSLTGASPTVKSFCDDVAAADTHCGRPQRQTACIEILKIFSDAALGRAQACLSKPCDLQTACVEDELGLARGTLGNV